MIGYPSVGVSFGIVAVISGVITGRAEIAAEATSATEATLEETAR